MGRQFTRRLDGNRYARVSVSVFVPEPLVRFIQRHSWDSPTQTDVIERVSVIALTCMHELRTTVWLWHDRELLTCQEEYVKEYPCAPRYEGPPPVVRFAKKSTGH